MKLAVLQPNCDHLPLHFASLSGR